MKATTATAQILKLLNLIVVGLITITYLFPTMAQSGTVRLIFAEQNANVRESASTTSAIVASLTIGQSAHVIGENPNGQPVEGNSLWYNVRVSESVEGWVWSGVVTVRDVVPTPTPTLFPTLAPNPDYQTLTVDNAKELRLAYSWGQGLPAKVAWAPDGTQIVVATTSGLWVYETDNLAAGAHQVYAFANPNRTHRIGQVGYVGNTRNIYWTEYTLDYSTGTVVASITMSILPSHLQQIITVAFSSDSLLGYFQEISQRVAVRSDGHYMALADENRIQLLELQYDASGENITEAVDNGSLEFDKEPLALTYSPDGSRLAVSVDDRTQIYDVVDHSLLADFDEKGVQKILYSPDAASLTLIGGNVLQTLDVNTGHTLQPYNRHYYSSLYDAAMRPDGLQLAVNFGSGILTFDTSQGGNSIAYPSSNFYTGFEYSPDGSRLVGVASTGELTIWATDTREAVYQDSRYGGRGPALSFIDDGGTLVEANEKLINVRHPEQAIEQRLTFPSLLQWGTSYSLRSDRVLLNALMFTSFGEADANDRSYVQTFSRDGSAISNRLNYDYVADRGFMMPMISSQAISPDGKTVILGKQDGAIWILDADTLTLKATVKQDCCAVYGLEFSGDGRYFISTAGRESALYIWSVDGQLVRRISVPTERYQLHSAVINATGSAVAAEALSHVYVWGVNSGIRLGPYDPPHGYASLGSIALSPDGRLLAVWDTPSGTITIFDVQTTSPLREIHTWEEAGSMRFSPDGALLVTSGYFEGRINFWGVGRISAPTATPIPAARATMATVLTPTQIQTNTRQPSITPSSTLTATLAPEILFQDAFEHRNLNGWYDPLSIGRFVADDNGNHYLHLGNNSDDFAVVSLPDRTWANYSFETRVRLQQGSMSLNIRENTHGQYSGNIDAPTSSASLSVGVNGNYHGLSGTAVNLQLAGWHHIQLQANGEQLTLLVDGVAVQSVTAHYHSEGGISFTLAPNSIADIDDVMVLALDDAP